MNEIAKFNDHEVSPWQAYADDVLASAIAGDMLKFVKGDWLRGEGDTAVPSDAMFIANMEEVWTGWVRWFDGNPAEHRISRLIDRAPKLLREDLGYLDKATWESNPDGTLRDPWAQTDRVVMKDDVSGELVTFVTGSYGGRWALARLLRTYARDHARQEGRFPVVTLGVDKTWKHDKFGTIPRPLFNVIGWSFWDNDAAASGAKAIEAPASTGAKLNDEIPF